MEALRHFAEAGYSSPAELQEWTDRLHAALESEMPSDAESKQILSDILGSVYARDFNSGIAKRVPGVSRYTLERIAPYLRAELDKRIFAGVDLIKLQKRSATEKTLQRFAGWTSSVPPGGLPPDTSMRDAAREIGMPVAQLKYERRRLAIDAGQKLIAAVASIVAENEGAIAAIWHDRGADDGSYDARPEHLKRSGKLFLIKDSWAIADGLIRRGAAPYTDSIEQPAYFVYCSCWYEYITSPHRIPEEMLTSKGRAYVAEMKAS